MIDSEEDTLLAIMQLLVQKKKRANELGNFLRGRGIRKFEDNEGSLYTLVTPARAGRLLTIQLERVALLNIID